mgnify:CR=1 FL=1
MFRIFDLIDQTPIFEPTGKVEKQLQQFEKHYQISLPSIIRNWFHIKNLRTIISPYVNSMVLPNELGQLSPVSIFNSSKTDDKNIEYFRQEYKSRRLLKLFRIGDNDIFIHINDKQNPDVYFGQPSYYNGQFVFYQSEHSFLDYMYLNVWDKVIAGSVKPKPFRKGWRFEIRGKALNLATFEKYFPNQLPPTLHIYYGRKFYRFQKDDQQFAWIFDDGETSYYYFYAHEEQDLIELLTFLKNHSTFTTKVLHFRRGHRSKHSEKDHVCDKTWQIVHNLFDTKQSNDQ